MDDLSRLIADLKRLRQDIEEHSRASDVRFEATNDIVGKLDDLRRRAERIQRTKMPEESK